MRKLNTKLHVIDDGLRTITWRVPKRYSSLVLPEGDYQDLEISNCELITLPPIIRGIWIYRNQCFGYFLTHRNMGIGSNAPKRKNQRQSEYIIPMANIRCGPITYTSIFVGTGAYSPDNGGIEEYCCPRTTEMIGLISRTNSWNVW